MRFSDIASGVNFGVLSGKRKISTLLSDIDPDILLDANLDILPDIPADTVSNISTKARTFYLTLTFEASHTFWHCRCHGL